MEENKILTDKKQFLKEEIVKTLSVLETETNGKWGKMNAQQMVEHLSSSFRLANGKRKAAAALDAEQTKQRYSFLMSEKPFRENTKNPSLPDEPFPLKNSSMKEALAELQKEIDDFFIVFSENPELRHLHPVFGNLNFEELVHFLHKHFVHHARQFGLVE